MEAVTAVEWRGREMSKGPHHDRGKKDGWRSASVELLTGIHGDMAIKGKCSSASSGEHEQRLVEQKGKSCSGWRNDMREEREGRNARNSTKAAAKKAVDAKHR